MLQTGLLTNIDTVDEITEVQLKREIEELTSSRYVSRVLMPDCKISSSFKCMQYCKCKVLLFCFFLFNWMTFFIAGKSGSLKITLGIVGRFRGWMPILPFNQQRQNAEVCVNVSHKLFSQYLSHSCLNTF